MTPVAGATPLAAIAASVAARESAAALLTGERTVSYREFDESSNAVAHLVLGAGEDPARPVGVCADRPEDFLAAIVGVLKAGHIYIPVDPAWPADRIRTIASSSGMRLVLHRSPSPLDTVGGLRLLDFRDAADRSAVAAPQQEIAYVVYTSGSTGTPKGVVRTHDNTIHVSRWNIQTIGIAPGDRVAWLSSPGSAVAAAEAFDALISGATLCRIPTAARPLTDIAADLVRMRVDIARIIPSLFRHLTVASGDQLRHSSLRAARISGEAVFRTDLELFRRHFPAGAVFQHAMASAEAGPVCSMNFGPEWEQPDGLLPVGRWADDPEMRILREDGSPTGPGEAGELVVSGPRVTPGFWSADGVVPSATVIEGRATLRTGDMLRRSEDDLLFFAGRRDAMVKVRGHRVDPTELEARLLALDGVREAAVVGTTDSEGDTRLRAFIAAPEELDLRTLRAHLARTVPAWMIPSRFDRVDALPRLAGGKLDRVALSAREFPAEPEEVQEAHPDELTEKLRTLWRETLGVSRVEDSDDFFEQGGDSLLAAHLAARIEMELGMTLLLSTLLENWTFGRLVAALRRPEERGFDVLVPLQPEGDKPPLYLTTGEGGNIFRFRSLAKELAPDQPLYGFQSWGLDGSEDVPETMEEIARRNVARLRLHRPRGPYLLAGYSLGGAIVWEMARQLRVQGEEVALLALIDSSASSRRVGTLLRLRNVVVRLVLRPGREARLLLRRVARRLRKSAPPATLRPFAYARVAAANSKAIRSYVYQPHPGNVLLLRARWGVRRSIAAPDLGWSGLVQGRLDIRELPGDHDSCTQEPACRVLAALLREFSTEALGAVRAGTKQ